MLSRRSVGAVARSGKRFLSTSEAAGIKVSSIDDGRAVSEVSLVVKAGARYAPAHTPAVAHILNKFAFRDTSAKSALRLCRESELLGGQLSSHLGREHLVLTAKFLREDLPYFVSALSNVASSTEFKPHELVEQVIPLASLEYQLAHANPEYVALENAYKALFRKGLGNALISNPKTATFTLEDVKAFSREAYTKANVSIVARGIVERDLLEIVGDKFGSLSSGSALSSVKTQAANGDIRVEAKGPNVVVLALPSSQPNCPKMAALASHLGSETRSVKWSLGGTTPLGRLSDKTGASISAKYVPYSDASVLLITVASDSALVAKDALTGVAKVLQGVAAEGISSEELTRAVAKARVSSISAAENNVVLSSLHKPLTDFSIATTDSIKDAASVLVKGPKALSSVGNIVDLPYADELF